MTAGFSGKNTRSSYPVFTGFTQWHIGEGLYGLRESVTVLRFCEPVVKLEPLLKLNNINLNLSK